MTEAKHGHPESGARTLPWQWVERTVDRSGEHFQLQYGSAEADPDTWQPVALVGPEVERAFGVEFVAGSDQATRGIREAAVKEIDLYLVELREENPWLYLQYHCGTASNVFSSIHWAYHPEASSSEIIPDANSHTGR